MVLATDVDVKGTDDVWRPMTVLTALSMRPDDRKIRSFRCRECKGHVTLHRQSKDGEKEAHTQHVTRWTGCPRSDCYDEHGLRPHPNPAL